MFRDEYNNEMNNIRPNADTKRIILEELQAGAPKERARRQQKSKIIWRVGVAAVACAVALAVVFFPPNLGTQPQINTSSGNEVLQAVSYNDVYKTLSQIYDKQNSGRHPLASLFDFIDGGTKDAVIEDFAVDDAIEYATDESTATGAVTTQTNSIEESNDSEDSHTETNTQVEGVDEADIVKTDGKYIYALYNGKGKNEVRIIKTDNGKITLVNTLKLEPNGYMDYSEMYLANDRLCITSNGTYYGYKGDTQVLIIDVSNPSNAKQIGVCKQNGGYHDSRLIGNHLYLISNYYPEGDKLDKDDPSSYVPCVKDKNTEYVTQAQDIRIYDCEDLEAVYTVVCGYDITNATFVGTQSVLGRCDAVYCSTQNILTARSCGTDRESGKNYSIVTRFSINKGSIKYITDNRINGTLLNQFSMDEADDSFRFVTTVSQYTPATYSDHADNAAATEDTIFIQTGNTSTSLYLLDHELKPLGKIEELAPGERVYSVRFMGDIAYFVTFRETDPLFSADLSDPKNPKILGQLKIPGFSNYLFPYGDGQLLGLGMDADPNTGRTECVKLSLFDINDPTNVTEHSKYLIEDSQYSDALYNHKASLIDSKRNLIGFACSIESRNELRYRIYSCKNGFEQVADLPLTNHSGYLSRGIIIGEILYLVEGYRATSYSLDGFTQLQSIVF